MIRKLLSAAAFALLPATLVGQAGPAVRGGIPVFSVGGFYSNFNPDFTSNRLSGAGVYFDWDLFGKLGAEGEARFLRFNQQLGSHEDTYLIGPRYHRRYGKWEPYAKFLLGAGELEFPSNFGHGGYFAMAPGGGVDYRLTRHLKLRGDYEYQFWPTAPGAGLPSHGLTPNGFSVGASYRIF